MAEENKVDPFSFMDFTLEEAIEADQKSQEQPRRDRRVCNCGHGVSRHKYLVNGTLSCQPTRMSCPCLEVKPVLEASDVRPFLRKTTGQAAFHALGRGLQAAALAGVEVTWLVDMKCDRCNAEGPIAPVAVTQSGIASDKATGYDVLLCRTCRTAI